MSGPANPRVLHVDTATEWRGGQQQLTLLKRSRPRDVWAGVPGSPLAERLGPPDVPLFPGADPRNLLRLRTGAARLGVDLVAAHTAHAHGLGLLAGPPLVVHRRVDFVPKNAWKYRLPRHLIAVSNRVRDVLLSVGVAPERVSVVYDGVDPLQVGRDIFETERPRLGSIGALVDHKGHCHLVAAMTELPGSLFIAGEGPLRGALEAQIRRLGLQDRVRLLGQRDDVPDLLASLDVLVHPSVEEGLGQVLIEALGAGCRVVATRAGGVPEVVGEAGVLVEPGDPTALVAGIRRALSEPGGGERAQAARFSVARMVAETGEVYRRVMAG